MGFFIAPSLLLSGLGILQLLLCDSVATAPTASWGKSQGTVPAPVQLMIASYNFKTVLYWNYSHTTPTPRFSVEVYDYKDTALMHIKTCKNITRHFCDISKEVSDPDNFYDVKVKAIVESKESSHAVKNDFSLRVDGRIGPPELKVTEDDPVIVVEVWHPVTPYKRKHNRTVLKTVRDFYDDFIYTVFERKSRHEYIAEECDEQKCIIKIPHRSNNVLYLSAEGNSVNWAIHGEKSEEKLFNVTYKEPAKDFRYRVYVIVAISLFTVVLFILATIFIVKLLKERNIQLPKSLVSVVRHFGPHTTTDAEHTSIVQTEPASPVSQNESILEQEELLAQETSNNEESIKEATTGHLLETSRDTEKEEIEGSCIEMTSDAAHSGDIKAYSVTDKNEPFSITLDSEVCPESSMKLNPLLDITNRNTSFGYNKPHALELILDTCEGETVLGYRPTPGE